MTYGEFLKAFIWVFRTIIKDKIKAIGIHCQNKLTSQTYLLLQSEV